MLFGNPCISAQELAEFLAKEITPYAARRYRRAEEAGDEKGKRRVRTEAVKIKLRRLGKKLGLQTFPDDDRRRSKPRSQWLYDLIWWNDSPGHKAVCLAVESEWNRPVGEVLHDFEKLLAVKSPLKLMIYRTSTNTAQTVRDGIEKYILNFTQHVDGEEYVFCEFQTGWKCFCYVLQVKSNNGRIRKVKFERLLET